MIHFVVHDEGDGVGVVVADFDGGGAAVAFKREACEIELKARVAA